jgi:hypothetical protein
MSSSISTPGELSSNARRAAGTCWRVVEAQHHVSTLKLTDTNAEQALLERLIEKTKPPVPPECEHLDYLLATPFRYYPPYPVGSRFRRAGATPGVFYASEHVTTAIAETAFWRLLFYAESPSTPWPTNAGEYTAFSCEYATRRSIDLTRPPFDKRQHLWSDPTKLGPCQDLADQARTEAIEVIKYMSVRDPQHRMNIALLSCRAFSRATESGRQTWRIHLSAGRVRAICEMPKQTIDFDRSAFVADPRTSKMKWERG